MLYSDSVLAWYNSEDKTRSSPQGGLTLSHSPDLLAAGQYSARVPGRPKLPTNVKMDQLIAVGRRPGNKVTWFVTRSEKEVEDWMSAIVSTLPAPPPPQQHPGGPPPQPGVRPPQPHPGKTILNTCYWPQAADN